MRVAIVVATGVAMLAFHVSEALAATTPGWECIPTTAGQAVVSGGTGAAPSCGAGTTAVLAPTFVASGVGGLPTVEFSGVNVQIVSGSGSTSGAVNGKGNLVVGYAENANAFARTGSNNLVVGSNGGWTGFGEIIGGHGNLVQGSYAAAFGEANTASGAESLVAGHLNTASGVRSSVTGGESNTAKGANAAIGGGQFDLAKDNLSFIGGGCDDIAGSGGFRTRRARPQAVSRCLVGRATR
jgi:hypothetical protein